MNQNPSPLSGLHYHHCNTHFLSLRFLYLFLRLLLLLLHSAMPEIYTFFDNSSAYAINLTPTTEWPTPQSRWSASTLATTLSQTSDQRRSQLSLDTRKSAILYRSTGNSRSPTYLRHSAVCEEHCASGLTCHHSLEHAEDAYAATRPLPHHYDDEPRSQILSVTDTDSLTLSSIFSEGSTWSSLTDTSAVEQTERSSTNKLEFAVLDPLHSSPTNSQKPSFSGHCNPTETHAQMDPLHSSPTSSQNPSFSGHHKPIEPHAQTLTTESVRPSAKAGPVEEMQFYIAYQIAPRTRGARACKLTGELERPQLRSIKSRPEGSMASRGRVKTGALRRIFQRRATELDRRCDG